MMKNKLLIFLAGPIEGKSWEEANEWREYVRKELEDLPILIYNPISRYELQLKNVKKIETWSIKNISVDEMEATNILYLKNADIILCNLMDGYSVGTSMEIGYGYATNKTIIVVCKDTNIHPLVSKWADLFYSTIDDAIEYIKNDLCGRIII
mgnify:CR=1 FL=1